MPIYILKITVFGGFYPLSGEVYQPKPQKHIIAWEEVMWWIDRQNRSTGATDVRGVMKRSKRPRKNLAVAHWLFA